MLPHHSLVHESRPSTPLADNAPDGREIYEGQRKLDLARAALRTLEAQDIFQQRMLEEQRLLIKALEYEADDTHPLRSTPSIIKDREYLQRRIEEEHLVLRSLEEEAEDIRAGWEEGLAQLGYVRRSLIARGIPIHPVDSGQKQRQNSFDGTSEDTSEDELHPFERPSPSPPQFRSPSPSASVPRSNHSLDFSENQSWPTTSERESEGVGNAFSPLY